MHKTIQNILGGLAGSVALTTIHQLFAKTVSKAPRIDLVGEEAVTETAELLGLSSPQGRQLFNAALAADVVSNALYYSAAGAGSDKYLVQRGAALGLIAGIGAITITDELGLDDKPITRTLTTRCMTVGYYAAGGLIAGIVTKLLRKTK